MNQQEERYFWIDKCQMVIGAEVYNAAELGEIDELFAIAKKIVDRIRAREEAK